MPVINVQLSFGTRVVHTQGSAEECVPKFAYPASVIMPEAGDVVFFVAG